jgi:hypothetical protein
LFGDVSFVTALAIHQGRKTTFQDKSSALFSMVQTASFENASFA